MYFLYSNCLHIVMLLVFIMVLFLVLFLSCGPKRVNHVFTPFTFRIMFGQFPSIQVQGKDDPLYKDKYHTVMHL